MDDGSDQQSGPHVVLVHGTWGRRSAWCRPGSRFWLALEEAGATVHSFTWSGGNSHLARSRAAVELASFLKTLRSETAPNGLAVIAHSHGGNVALHAVRRLAPGSRRVKLVTLATPFLFAASTKPARSEAVVLVAAAVAAVAILFAVVVGPEAPMGSPLTIPSGVAALLVLAVRALSWVAARHVHGLAGDDAAVSSLVSSIQVPAADESTGEDLLVIRAADDEAGGLLTFAQFSGWMGFTIARFVKPVRVFVAVWILGVVIYEVESAVSGEDGNSMGSLSGFIADWSFTTSAICAVLLSLPALFACAHGWDGPAVSWRALVTAEASPPGETDVWQCSIRASRAQGLAHASLYDEPQVIARAIRHVYAPREAG